MTRYLHGNDALTRALAARAETFSSFSSVGDAAWARQWRWRNEWVNAMKVEKLVNARKAEKAAADPRLAETKGEPPDGKAS